MKQYGLFLLFFWIGCSTVPQKELLTVPFVDLKRYVGLWYEIARLPHSFEENCVGVTAEYEAREDGSIHVSNRCYEKTFTGPLKVAHGTAKVVDQKNTSKLKVSFFWPFSGDYWILELGSNYEYAVVGSPDRRYFWILSRTPQIHPLLFKGIIDRFSQQGFDFSALYATPQKQAATHN